MFPVQSGRHITSDMSLLQCFQVQFRAVSRNGRNLFGLPSKVCSDLFHQRNHLMPVAAVVIETLRHDNLPVSIHGHLGVICLDERITAFHQSTFRVR